MTHKKQIKFKYVHNNEIEHCSAHLFAGSPWCLTLQPYCWVATEKPCGPPHLKYLLFHYLRKTLPSPHLLLSTVTCALLRKEAFSFVFFPFILYGYSSKWLLNWISAAIPKSKKVNLSAWWLPWQQINIKMKCSSAKGEETNSPRHSSKQVHICIAASVKEQIK